ncbi:MAG TPA: hypothetical protein VE863_20265 [Pyrinomonadaceae bacterium]|jgi:hypothetical protein|nr:hypothetical protein [Pyrinomonadaceae bacterium]
MGNSANVWVPILVAIVTGLVTVITVFLTGRANRRLERDKFDASRKLEKQKFETSSKLERQKFESSLILQSIATGEQETAQKNLEFLVNAGFLPDPEGKIKELAKRPADTPVLPARGGSPQTKARAPVFRWKVRTGADPDAELVEEKPVQITIEKLAAKHRPADMKDPTKVYPAYQDRRAEGVERTIYEVEAVIVAHKLQMSGSYHLDLQGETGRTIIANSVDPQHVDPGSRWAKQIATVRKEVEERLKPGPVYTGGSWRVRITGIGFFNQVHGQHGVAPNGIELTPVLSIEWLS